MATKNFALVRWIEQESVGVMPMSAAPKTVVKLYDGLKTQMHFGKRSKKLYDVEVLKVSSE